MFPKFSLKIASKYLKHTSKDGFMALVEYNKDKLKYYQSIDDIVNKLLLQDKLKRTKKSKYF